MPCFALSTQVYNCDGKQRIIVIQQVCDNRKMEYIYSKLNFKHK